MPRMPKGRPKQGEPLVMPVRSVSGNVPGQGGLRPSFQAQTRGLNPQQIDNMALERGFIDMNELVQRRAARRQ